LAFFIAHKILVAKLRENIVIMNHLIEKLHNNESLNDDDIRIATDFLLNHNASAQEKALLLEALSNKGETPIEIAAFVNLFLQHSIDPGIDSLTSNSPTLDLCGTGGDHLNLFNVSTTAMFVAAGAGALVIKHGNRGVTSKSGGADVLEALNININLSPEKFRDCVEKCNLGFLFAPIYHPAFKAVTEARKLLAERKIRTIFNLIGPLLNPCKPQYQLVGVFKKELCPIFAEILTLLGRKSAWVVNGSTKDGKAVDEISLMGVTQICKIANEKPLQTSQISPEEFGLKRADILELQGGEAKENAVILENILNGKDTGAKRDIVILNAGAAITCAGIATTMEHGIRIARESISSGAALNKLRLLQRYST
jgi:anthranilate phosphoribosyltransferase